MRYIEIFEVRGGQIANFTLVRFSRSRGGLQHPPRVNSLRRQAFRNLTRDMIPTPVRSNSQVEVSGTGPVLTDDVPLHPSPTEPNALWCADYKGEFMLGNRRYCYPLTITDFASRYLLTCEALSTTQERFAFTVFERTFKEFGLPQAIRTDNGVPVRVRPRALSAQQARRCGGSASAFRSSGSSPGIPQQNGRHERMHLTLKKEATKPAAANVLQQQARFDAFVDAATTSERPHQALGHESAGRPLRALAARLSRPRGARPTRFTTRPFTVTHCGRICFNGRKVNLSHVFAGQNVGVTQVGERIWLVTFMHYDLGYFDDETCRLEPIENPFGPKVLPMSPE